VYIFERNQGGPDNWGEVKKLTALDGARQAQFGRVAIYEDTVIVGAPADDIGANIDQGSIYIFERNQGGPNNWAQVKKINGSDGGRFDDFGAIVKIYRDTLIVGAPGDDIGGNSGQGSAYIFERNQGGPDNWGEVKKLTASDGAESDFFGAVAIYEDTVIVGAFRHAVGSNLSQGAAYIFERNQGGPDNWGEVKKLTASDGAEADAFGVSAAIYEDTVIVGASGNPFFDITTPGSAYVFERNQGGADNWGEVKILTASDSVDPDFFGISTAIYEDTVIVGAPIGDISRGAAYIYVARNSPPTISAAGVTRAEGAAAANSTIAAVSDPDQGADTLMVTVNGSPSATVNGVTVSNITVDAAGEVRADVVAACGASNAGFTLRVTDGEGLSAEATLDVTVTPEDVAPTLTLRPSIQLWPPNHTYRTVTVEQMVESVSDNCSPLGVGDVVIEKVTSDEPDDAPGLFDGCTTEDIVIAHDCRSVRLRAERSETKDGRVYAITLRLRDGRGNATRRDFEVSVPIGQNGVPAVKGVTALTVTGGCQ
jgi:FG-GAP repeat protein